MPQPGDELDRALSKVLNEALFASTLSVLVLKAVLVKEILPPTEWKNLLQNVLSALEKRRDSTVDSPSVASYAYVQERLMGLFDIDEFNTGSQLPRPSDYDQSGS